MSMQVLTLLNATMRLWTADSPATTSPDEAVEPFFGILLALASCSGEEELREDGRSLLLPGQDVDTMTATASGSSPILKSVAN